MTVDPRFRMGADEAEADYVKRMMSHNELRRDFKDPLERMAEIQRLLTEIGKKVGTQVTIAETAKGSRGTATAGGSAKPKGKSK